MAAYNLDEKTGLLGKFGIKLSAKVLKENDLLILSILTCLIYAKHLLLVSVILCQA
jgi:hypothetical protein